MKSSLRFFMVLIMAVAFMSTAANAEAKFIGVKMCGACHKGDKNKNVYEKWEKSGHAKAFKTLQTDQAKKIATKMGIADASASDKCLVCHVTNSAKKDEGVSCESCHGAGSDYKSKDVMSNREMAVKKGLVLGHNDSKLCEKCHNPKSPTYKKFEYAKAWASVKHPIK
ncbi:MAG: multiheme c-type cytochrome [Methanococcaceae archaeon]